MKKYAMEDFVTGTEIRRLRKRLGLTQADFAELVKVSKKTVERWESGENSITGPIITLFKLLWENPQIEESLQIPQKTYPLRMWYMFRGEVCTIIDIDDQLRKIKIRNYTKDPIRRAFGKNENPNYEDYEEFLESRCFPRS